MSLSPLWAAGGQAGEHPPLLSTALPNLLTAPTLAVGGTSLFPPPPTTIHRPPPHPHNPPDLRKHPRSTGPPVL